MHLRLSLFTALVLAATSVPAFAVAAGNGQPSPGSKPGCHYEALKNDRVSVVTRTTSDPYVYHAGSYIECGNAQVDVPAGKVATIVATYNAEVACYNPTPTVCTGRFVVANQELLPAQTAGDPFVFAASRSDVGTHYETVSIQRSLRVFCPTSRTSQFCGIQVFPQLTSVSNLPPPEQEPGDIGPSFSPDNLWVDDASMSIVATFDGGQSIG